MDPTLVDMNTRTYQFISENSEIPHDITFKFSADDGEISANKTILAMVSGVFRNMFFVHNTVDKAANEIVMEDTTSPPFQIMIHGIYNAKPVKESLAGKSVPDIFAVLYLVNKYEIPELVLAVKECIASFTITEANVMEVATDAMEYLSTFEEDVHSLLISCANFLKSKFTDNESIIRFVAANGDRMATVHKLAVIIKDLPPCDGCKRMTGCLDGKIVTKDDVKVGVKVVRNPNSMDYRPNASPGIGFIVRKDDSGENRWVVRWEDNQENGNWHINIGRYFLFKCH